MPSTIILATQRTGSTLLCAEFEAIGGLGRPGEHFLTWLQTAPADALLPEAALDSILDPGRDPDGNVGVKLMADYLPGIARRAPGAVAGEEPVAATVRFVEALARWIGPAVLFRIDRGDLFDQALSGYLAVSTGVYFRTEEGEVTRPINTDRDSHEAALADLNIIRLERHLLRLAADRAFLDRVVQGLGRPVLAVEYDALSERREAVLAACCAHAACPLPGTLPPRWMKKVVDRDLRDRFRQRAAAIWRGRAAQGQNVPAVLLAATAG